MAPSHYQNGDARRRKHDITCYGPSARDAIFRAMPVMARRFRAQVIEPPYLSYRRQRWAATTSPYLLVSSKTAHTGQPVTSGWMHNLLRPCPSPPSSSEKTGSWKKQPTATATRYTSLPCSASARRPASATPERQPATPCPACPVQGSGDVVGPAQPSAGSMIEMPALVRGEVAGFSGGSSCGILREALTGVRCGSCSPAGAAAVLAAGRTRRCSRR